MPSTKPPVDILLVRPGHAGGVAGNDQTAERWRRQLLALPSLVSAVHGPLDPREFERHLAQFERSELVDQLALLALHAEKSAPAIAAFAVRHPGRPILLALGGTDANAPGGWSPASARSLDLATHILCFHGLLIERLERPAWRAKGVLLCPSAEPIPAAERAQELAPAPPWRVLLLANLRAVKAPLLAALAAQNLPPDLPIQIEHYGQVLEPAFERELTQLHNPHFRFLGPIPPAAARQALARCHLLINTSLQEGASNALVEALASAIPVLASDVPGNRALLGAEHPGLFPSANAIELATLLMRFASDDEYRRVLANASEQLAAKYHPQSELKQWEALLERCCRTPRWR